METFIQILYRVGRGLLKLNLDDAVYNVSKALKALFDSCMKFNRDERPEFSAIQENLQNMLDMIPAIRRSNSEPTLNRNQWQSEDFPAYNCPSPKTPANMHMTNVFFPLS